MSPGFRRAALYGVLVLLLSLAAASWFTPDAALDAGYSAPVSRSTPGAARADRAVLGHDSGLTNDVSPLAVSGRPRDVIARDDKNPFEVKTWVATPPSGAASDGGTPVPAPPPPQPTTPALPFLFAGKLEVAPGKWLVYLTKGEQSIAVEMGETFDGVYRFDGIENDNIIIVYLPLQTKQLLPMGSAS